MFQESNENLRLVALNNNLPTAAIDGIISKTGRIANIVKYGGFTFMIAGVVLDGAEGISGYIHGDGEKVKRAAFNGALGIGTYFLAGAVGGIPAIGVYILFRCMMRPNNIPSDDYDKRPLIPRDATNIAPWRIDNQ